MTKPQHATRLIRKVSSTSLLCCTLMFLPFSLPAQGNSAETKPELTVELNELNQDEFTYTMEGRPDPFVPFLQPQAKKVSSPDVEVNTSDKLTGMQLFEPGQLSLVGIMGTEGENIALVQDSTGKGYVIKEGMKIGRRGVISEITPKIVRLLETTRFRSGKEVQSKIDMVLKKEGEE